MTQIKLSSAQEAFDYSDYYADDALADYQSDYYNLGNGTLVPQERKRGKGNRGKKKQKYEPTTTTSTTTTTTTTSTSTTTLDTTTTSDFVTVPSNPVYGGQGGLPGPGMNDNNGNVNDIYGEPITL